MKTEAEIREMLKYYESLTINVLNPQSVAGVIHALKWVLKESV